MFDYHIHSTVSFDGKEDALTIAKAAKKIGLREICFTDHYDFNSERELHHDLFTKAEYDRAYGDISISGLSIKRGVEFGLTTWNAPELGALDKEFGFDYIIGSVHYVKGFDPYCREYWLDKDERSGFLLYLERVLECVKVHSNFDALGHINYVCKSVHNPTRSPLFYKDYRELCDEIMREIARKGIGMEINTSGIDRVGAPLPDADFLRRFRELGGEIVTVGSDAHNSARVGQYIPEALEILKETFGYVCTFEKRKPIFHKL